MTLKVRICEFVSLSSLFKKVQNKIQFNFCDSASISFIVIIFHQIPLTWWNVPVKDLSPHSFFSMYYNDFYRFMMSKEFWYLFCAKKTLPFHPKQTIGDQSDIYPELTSVPTRGWPSTFYYVHRYSVSHNSIPPWFFWKSG